MLPLASLGQRIMLVGPSNAGKSTLAVALSNKLNIPPVHLDQLHHLPNTNWTPRPVEDFDALHDQAIGKDQWIIDGNYSRLVPRRCEFATGAIVITSNKWLRLARYLRRTLITSHARQGSLEGGPERLTWEMTNMILFKTPKKAAIYAAMIESAGVPMVKCHTLADLKALYTNWGLKQP